MVQRQFTFDRFARTIIYTFIALGVFFLIRYLSDVLLPFAIGWLIAYILYPIVIFFQKKMRLKSRILSIVVTMLLLLALLSGFSMLVVPLIINEIELVRPLIASYIDNLSSSEIFGVFFEDTVKSIEKGIDYNNLLSFESIEMITTKIFPRLWGLISNVWQLVIGIFIVFIVILYIIFILMDFEKLSKTISKLFSVKYQRFVNDLLEDLTSAMNSYFRGQALIALIVGILYCIGFSIIGLPMAIAMGILIGVLHIVPYLQSFGFIPVVFLTFINSLHSDTSFWVMMIGVLIVFVVIQLLNDLILVPKIMGKNMGLKPAIILLSLSVWGVLLGFLGLIIALPITTIIISYYSRFVVGNEIVKQ